LCAAACLTVALIAPAAARAASVSIVPSTNPGTSNILGGLVAFAPADVWGVGTTTSPSYAGCHSRTLTIHSTGGAFADVTPVAAICGAVNAAAGTSSSDLWAVGSANTARDPQVRHYDGTTWTASAGADLPVPPSGGRRLRSTGLNAVAALAPNNVWAAGKAEFADQTNHTLLEHFDGSGWQLVNGPTATASAFNGISALGAGDVWAVGAAGGNTLAAHYDGSRWSTVPTPNANLINTLNGVAAIAPSNVWAVGSSVKNPNDGVSVSHTLIEHYNGTSWSVVSSPNVGAGNNVLTGVAAHSATDVWAVGYDDDITGSIPVRKTVWMHWDGVRWSTFPSPNVGTSDNWLVGVIAPAGTTDAWAWGFSPDGTLVERVH
jgi:hypothetical protein